MRNVGAGHPNIPMNAWSLSSSEMRSVFVMETA